MCVCRVFLCVCVCLSTRSHMLLFIFFFVLLFSVFSPFLSAASFRPSAFPRRRGAAQPQHSTHHWQRKRRERSEGAAHREILKRGWHKGMFPAHPSLPLCLTHTHTILLSLAFAFLRPLFVLLCVYACVCVCVCACVRVYACLSLSLSLSFPTLSPVHPFPLSPFRPFTPSPFHPFALSPPLLPACHSPHAPRRPFSRPPCPFPRRDGIGPPPHASAVAPPH